jgi:16S rRNA processing protein RimM
MKHAYDPETVVLGVVGRPHGIHGEVWLRPHNARGTSFDRLKTLLLERDGVRQTLTLTDVRSTPDGAIVSFAGVDTREAAAALTLSAVRAPRSALPPLGPDEYYVDDVIGCAVEHREGQGLGLVTGTFWNGAHDVMVIDDAGRERLIPLVPHVVVTADVAARRMVVEWNDVDDE